MQVERHSDKWQGIKTKRYKGAKTKELSVTVKPIVHYRRCKETIPNKIISQEQTSKLLRRRYPIQFVHTSFLWQTRKFDISGCTLKCGFIKCYFIVHNPTGRGYTHLPGNVRIWLDFENDLVLIPEGGNISPARDYNLHNMILINTR